MIRLNRAISEYLTGLNRFVFGDFRILKKKKQIICIVFFINNEIKSIKVVQNIKKLLKIFLCLYLRVRQ